MSDFKGPGPSYSGARVVKHASGLWSAEMDHPYAGQVVSRGHFNKSEAKAGLRDKALKHFGKTPVFHETGED